MVDPKLLKLDLQKYQVIANFLLEAMESRKEPVDLRLILFQDEQFSHEELVAGVNSLAHHSVKQDPVYSKDELGELLAHVREQIDNFQADLND